MVGIIVNRTALKELIDKDPEFELQLKSSVLSEIGRRFFEKDAANVIRAAGGELFKKALDALQNEEDINFLVNEALKKSVLNRSNYTIKVSDDIKKAIFDLVEQEKNRIILSSASTIVEAFNNAIEKAVNERINKENITEIIEKRVERLTIELLNKRVEEIFNERMRLLQSTVFDT